MLNLCPGCVDRRGVDVCRAHRNGAHVGDAVLACEALILFIASDHSK
jgi:hypothetical protein